MTPPPLTAAEARDRTTEDVIVITLAELDDVLAEASEAAAHVPEDVDDDLADVWVSAKRDGAMHVHTGVEARGRTSPHE